MTQILESIEVRWFLSADDRNVPSLERLFDTAEDVESRSDFYAPTGREDLGVKARVSAGAPARIETKYRTASLGSREITAGVVGSIERWSKISLEVAEAERSPIEQAWRKIGKRRRRRKIAIIDDHTKEIGADDRVDVGCSAELTKLEFKIGNKVESEWTFGFEAFSTHAAELEAVLVASVHHVLGDTAAFLLEAASSRGYPAWLTERFW
ncbi:MAG: hypothetical protein HOW73_11160 [Polyangiaceae bacterium]|nr:hypothetical protein [Polyangiaceae bacterium]